MVQHAASQPATSTSSMWQARLINRDPQLHIYLIGIGGAGLSAIAKVLLDMGIRVSGSDRQASAHSQRLAAAGAQIYTSQHASNLLQLAPDDRPHVVLISSAIAAGNPERQAAEQLALPVVKRAEFLPVLLEGRQVIGVAGAHGKSTTTAMIVQTLIEAGMAPGYIVGADLPTLGNAAAGSSPTFVIEADEYDHMFLGLRPALAVITNVEWDHPDCYPTPASFHQAFHQYIGQVMAGGAVISCQDDPGAEELRAMAPAQISQWMTYGMESAANLRAIAPQALALRGYSSPVHWHGQPVGALDLAVPGLHNLLNALAAATAAHWCGVPFAQAFEALAHYTGVARRFELKGESAGITIIDDYAHHPSEIMATLAGARQRYPGRRIWAIFQPHTFSRTRNLLQAMSQSFADADRVIVTDIFAAREQDDGQVSAAALVAASTHHAIRYIPTLESAAAALYQEVQPGDVVITLGAGNSNRVGELLLQQLVSVT
jgi:UDP-N-acetylmuramate--alanine ligase